MKSLKSAVASLCVVLSFAASADLQPKDTTTISAIGGTCYGSTAIGSTNWIQYVPSGLYLDVDISECGFDTAPHVIVNTHGNAHNWLLTGGSSAYNKTATSFRVYVKHPNNVTPAQANSRRWHVQWVARVPSS